MIFSGSQVHPLDLGHGDNPASHPELLDLLANEFVKAKFNHKEILGQIAKSKAYQRSSQVPKGLQDKALAPLGPRNQAPDPRALLKH